MRVLAVVLVALFLGSNMAAAQMSAEDRGLQAALSPVQTVVDASSTLVNSALDEAARDGTPDAAWAILAKLQNFTARLDEAWTLPRNATYGDAAIAALPYAREVASIVASVPDDAATAAVSSTHCALGTPLTTAEKSALRSSIASLHGAAALLNATAAHPPNGVDAAGLRGASAHLQTWRPGFLVGECLVVATTQEPPFLRLRITPPQAWPTAQVSVIGVTNLPGTAHVSVRAFDIATDVATHAGVFTLPIIVPRNISLGPVAVTASVGNLSAQASFDVVLAPVRIRVDAPSRIAPGTDALLSVSVESPLRDITDRALVRVEGNTTTQLQFVDGRASLSIHAPDHADTLTYSFSYAGDALTTAAQTAITIHVVPNGGQAPLPGSAAQPSLPLGGSENSPTSAPLASAPFGGLPTTRGGILTFVLILALLAIILIVGVVLGVRRLRRPRSARATVLVEHAVLPFDEPARVLSVLEHGVVSAFVMIVRFLRRRGEVTPSMTAREIADRLDVLGAPSQSFVSTFERVRYGGELEEPSWAQRARAWVGQTMARLGGSAP